jgi:hypothetical protein
VQRWVPVPASESDLDRIADSLYALKPDEFSSARDQAVREARQSGDRELAREIGQLRKPTMSAWLVNVLWRDQHDVMEQLFDLSRELARAQAEAAGPELRALTQQRRQLETALLRRAVELAAAEGVNVSDSVQREAQETLSAALAQPEVADEVRTGRLTKAASYAGFGSVAPAAAAPARPRPERAEPPKEPIDLRAAQRAREQREAAQRKIDQAQQAAETASAQVAQAKRAEDVARQRHDDLRQQLRAVREQLQRVESDVESAERAKDEAEDARKRAETAHSEALRALSDAEKALRGA